MNLYPYPEFGGQTTWTCTEQEPKNAEPIGQSY